MVPVTGRQSIKHKTTLSGIASTVGSWRSFSDRVDHPKPRGGDAASLPGGGGSWCCLFRGHWPLMIVLLSLWGRKREGMLSERGWARGGSDHAACVKVSFDVWLGGRRPLGASSDTLPSESPVRSQVPLRPTETGFRHECALLPRVAPSKGMLLFSR